MNAVNIRPVQTATDLDRVSRLVHDVYVSAGYFDPRPDGRLSVYGEYDPLPETLVLAAFEGDDVVGTLSITLDGPHGMSCEHDFGPACAAIRAEGRPLMAVWRNATADSHRTSRIDLELIRTGAVFGIGLGIGTFVSTVEPSLERAYVKLFGMTTVARTDGVDGVRGAGLLMCGSVPETYARLKADGVTGMEEAVQAWRRRTGRMGWVEGGRQVERMGPLHESHLVEQ
ncbi:MAG: hypothetical protein IPL60_14730 [Ardenticatenia bacterium]|nr:hypothetical protein [Ardenticatenia bacterium]